MDPDWLRDYAWAIWTGIAMLLGVAELISLDLILLMLAGGALVGALTALLQLAVPLQVLAAVATSVAMLAVVRPNDEDAVIEPGAKVDVFDIRGATAVVHKIPEIGA